MFFGSIAIAVMAIGIISIVEEQTIISIINSSNQSAAVTASVESSGCIQITKILQLGSTDATSSGQVTKLQRFLQERGYLPYSSQTGSYNTSTKQAVVAFERAQGISPDGIVGLVTAEKIKQISCSDTGTETPNPTTYSVKVVNTSAILPGGQVHVSWGSPTGANIQNDWIALYRVGAANSTYSMWKYTTGVSGTMTLLAPQTAGTYELRYLKNNGYTSVAKSAQFVVGNGTTVTPSPSNYTVQVAKSSVIPGGQIDISWTSPSTANIVKDWIALYEVGAMNATYGPWHYTSGSSGTMVLSAPQKAGSYEVRYLKNNTFTSVAKSAQFRIGSGSTPGEIPTPNPTPTPNGTATPHRTTPAAAAPQTTRTVQVGPNREIKTLSQLQSALQNGTKYVIDPGIYSGKIKIDGKSNIELAAADSNNWPIFSFDALSPDWAVIIEIGKTSSRIKLTNIALRTTRIAVQSGVQVSGTDTTIDGIRDYAPITTESDSAPTIGMLVRQNGTGLIVNRHMGETSFYAGYLESGSRTDWTNANSNGSLGSHYLRTYTDDFVFSGNRVNDNPVNKYSGRRALLNIKEGIGLSFVNNPFIAGEIQFGPLADGNGNPNDTPPARDILFAGNTVELINSSTIRLEAGAGVDPSRSSYRGVNITNNTIKATKDFLSIDAVEPYKTTRGIPRAIVSNNKITGPTTVRFIGNGAVNSGGILIGSGNTINGQVVK